MDPQSTPSPALSTGARTPAPRKHTPRVTAERTEVLAHLSLDGLRDYRKALTHEEGNVSYWRRIIQARLDLVRQGTDAASANLRPVLTDKRVGAGRQALVQIVPVDDIPPLPDLAGLWAQQVDPSDTVALADLEVRLAAAEASCRSTAPRCTCGWRPPPTS